MNKYTITLKIIDKFDLSDEETQEILLITDVLANSQEEAIQKLNFYNIVEVLSIEEG
jgi:hypothetical protein